MKTLIALAAASVAVSGCAGIPKPTPEPLSVTVKAISEAAREAGCTINFSLGAGGATGQLGGSAHAENSLSGGCDPSKAIKPLSMITASDLAGL